MIELAHIARTFVDARARDLVLDSYPGSLPDSLVEGYAVQDRAIEYAERRIGGWKVGRVQNDDVARFGAERLAGPIFADTIIDGTAAEPVTMPVLTAFAAAEAEVLLRIAAPPPADCDAARARDFVDEVRFGIEIASSPFVGINQHGPAVTVSDFGNNNGLVLGPVIPDAREPRALELPVILWIDGVSVGTGSARDMLDGPFGSLAFLARLMSSRGRALEAGQWVSTGAITGVHPVRAGQSVRATFGASIAVECNTSATPIQAVTERRAPWTQQH